MHLKSCLKRLRPDGVAGVAEAARWTSVALFVALAPP